MELDDELNIFSCCSSRRHLRCMAPRLSAVSEEVSCPDCPLESRDHVSADWFHRLCLINGVEWSGEPELGDCVHRSHDGCGQHRGTLLQAVRPCGLSRSIFLFTRGGLPFCNQSLADFARSSSFMASSLFHGCMIDFDLPPSNQGLNSLVLPSGFPRPPDLVRYTFIQIAKKKLIQKHFHPKTLSSKNTLIQMRRQFHPKTLSSK